jgi:hypothetical protein
MKYYLFSFIISIILFILIQYMEYKKVNEDINEEPYNLFKLANVLLFIIIYIVSTIAIFYLNASNMNVLSFLDFSSIVSVKNKPSLNTNNDIKEDIDPKVLSKINDNFDTGFAPFDDDINDDTSLSSISSIKSDN